MGAPLLPYILVSLGLDGWTTRRLKAPLPFLILCAAIGVAWFSFGGFSHWLSLWGVVLSLAWLGVQLALQVRGPRPRAAIAWSSLALAMLAFLVESRVARGKASDWVAANAGNETLAQIVTTPRGANPFCWRVITVTENGDDFTVRLGVTSLSSLVDQHHCFAPPGGNVPRSVCLEAPPPGQADSPIEWLAVFKGSKTQFERHASADSGAGLTRHFLRAPFWGPDARNVDCKHETPCSQRILIGDMRVDYDKEDLGTFSKYSFLPSLNDQSIQSTWPVGDPPFFEQRTHETSR